MSGNVSVKPTPIQRNPIDAAMELTQMYFKQGFYTGTEKLEDIYSKFYALTYYLDRSSPSQLIDLVPEEILKKIK